MWFMDLVVILWVCTFCMFNGEFEVETDRMDCGEAIPGDGVPLDIGWSCGATGMVAVVLMGGISEPCTGGTEGSARLHCSDTDLWKRMWAEHLVVVEEEDFFHKCYVTRCINSSVGFQVEVEIFTLWVRVSNENAWEWFGLKIVAVVRFEPWKIDTLECPKLEIVRRSLK